MAFGRPPTFQEYVAQRMAQALAPDAAAAIPLPTPNAALPFGPAGVPGNAQQLAEPGRQAANLPAPTGPVASPLELIAALQAAAAAAPQPGSGVAVVGNAPVGSSLPVRVRSTPGAGVPAFSPMVSIPNPQQGPPLPPGGVVPVAPPLTPQESQAPSSSRERAITNQRSRAVLDQQQQVIILRNNVDGARALQQKLIGMGMDEAQAAQTAAALVIRRGQRGQATTVKDVESGQLNMDLTDLAAGNAPDLASDVTRAAVDYLAAAPGEISQGVQQTYGPLVDVTAPVVRPGLRSVRDTFAVPASQFGGQVAQIPNIPVDVGTEPPLSGGGDRAQQFQNDPASLAPGSQQSGTVAQGPTIGSVAGQFGGAVASGASAVGGAVAEGTGNAIQSYGDDINAATGVDAGDVGQAVETVIAASDIPRQYVIDGLGTLSYYLAKAGLSTSENRADIESAYENGYMSPAGVYTPPGGRAVWEATIAAMPDDWPVVLRAMFHITTDTLTDPLTYLGTVAKAGDALEASARAAQAAGDVNKAAALNAAAQLLKAPDLVFNKSVEKGFDKSRELVSRVNPFTPQTEIGNATEEISGARQQVNRARAEVEAAGEGGQPVPGNAGPMGGGGPTQPSLAPQPGPTSGTAPTGGGGAPVAEPVFGQGPVVMTPEQRAAYRQAQQANVGGAGTRLQQDELIGGRNAGPVTTLTPEQTERVMQTPPVAEAGTAQAVITKAPPAPDVRPEPGNATATITVDEPPAPNVANEPQPPPATAREAAPGAPTPEPDVAPAGAPEPQASAGVPQPARPQDILPAARTEESTFDANRAARRQRMEQLPPDVVSLPKKDLDWLDPSYVSVDPANPPTFGEVMAFQVLPRRPEAAPKFWEDYTKLADAHMKVDDALARAAGEGASKNVQQTPRRVAERVKFQLDRAALVERDLGESWVDGQEWERQLPVVDPDRPSGYDPATRQYVFGADIDQPGGMDRFISDVFTPHTLSNGQKEAEAYVKQRVRPLMRAMVEAAGIGPDDAEAAERGLVAARQARYFLRQADAEPLARQLLDGESPKRLAGELSDLRKTAYGEGALSQRKTSAAARERAKRQAVTVERIGKQQQWLVGTNLPAEQQGLLRKDADGFILDLPGQESAPVPKEASSNATRAKQWAQEQIANFLLDQRKSGFLPGSARRGMAATDLASSKVGGLVDRLQPRPIEASAEPAFVPERTEADLLYNRGGIDDETRDTLNMEIRTPVLAKTSRGDTYDKGLRERVSPNKATAGPVAPEVQRTLGGRQTGFTTVLDAIDTLVAAGVDDAQVNTIVGRLVAEARGVNVARALKLPETGWERTLAKIKKGWGGWRAFIRENTQFGIHRIASGLVQDAIGDGWTAQAFGDWRTALEQFNPGLFRASVVDVRAGNLDALMRAGKLDYLNDLGETLPHDLIAFTEGRSESALSGPTMAGKVTVKMGNRTIRPLSFLASEYARDMRTAGDRLRRILAFDHVMRREMRGASERFDVALVKRAEAKGVDPAQWRQAITDQADAAGKGYLFSPEDIRRATGDETLARAWRSEIKQARKRGVAVVNKMYFTYKQTELDRVLSQVTFFHYWMSRATVMHAEMALRHPRLIATYWRFWQGLKQEADRQGYPDTLKTFIRFLGDTKGGWYAYADPLSLIIPFTMFRELDRDNAAWYERIGLYINPMVMGAAAAAGMTDSIPDLLGTRGLENRIMPVWNLLQAHGVVGDGVPDQGVIQRITQAVVGLMNEGVRSVIPPARQFEPFSATGYIHDQLITLIDARAEQLYGPRAGWGQDVQDQVHAAYASLDVDPRKNPLSAWAVDQWAGQSVKGAALSWFVPVRNRLAVRDEQVQLNSAGNDAYFDNNPDTNPTPEQQAAHDARDRARSGDPVLVDLTQRYQAIGTPSQQAASKLWGAVAYAGNEDQIPTIEDLNGDRVLDFGQGNGPLPERITLDDLMAMDSKERMAVADRMVARRGVTADLLNYRHQRDAFKEANPAIQPFLDYQKVAYDYPGGVMAFANDLRRVSPNFNAYLTEQEARGPLTQNDVTGVDAYIAQRGDQPDVYGPPPQDASNPNAIPGVQTLTGAGGGSGSASEDTTAKPPKPKKEPKTPAEKDTDAINKDLDQIAEWQAAVNTVLSQGGNTIPYDQLEQFSRAAVDQELAANGIRKPSVGSTTRLYLLWRASQPAGADTSVEAFVRYLYDTKNQPNGDGA